MGAGQKNTELSNPSEAFEAQHQQAIQQPSLTNKLLYNNSDTDQLTSNQIQQTLK